MAFLPSLSPPPSRACSWPAGTALPREQGARGCPPSAPCARHGGLSPPRPAAPSVLCVAVGGSPRSPASLRVARAGLGARSVLLEGRGARPAHAVAACCLPVSAELSFSSCSPRSQLPCCEFLTRIVAWKELSHTAGPAWRSRRERHGPGAGGLGNGSRSLSPAGGRCLVSLWGFLWENCLLTLPAL